MHDRFRRSISASDGKGERGMVRKLEKKKVIYAVKWVLILNLVMCAGVTLAVFVITFGSQQNPFALLVSFVTEDLNLGFFSLLAYLYFIVANFMGAYPRNDPQEDVPYEKTEQNMTENNV